jgi:hypothetical protein
MKRDTLVDTVGLDERGSIRRRDRNSFLLSASRSADQQEPASKQEASGYIPQKMILFITTAVKTSNPTKLNKPDKSK